ncbi:hypothetical protein JN11_01542 [Mucilaginibacter frigoritolerans]|uniref:Uncharacterized protein n=1 Tax=Mucilaginibacter frigoritolerans TaxID=652788 RepID=A0A562UAA3_9SPHI|nr:hypothetical protein [Mucilaginibacter frigoritolerans]TWJ02569.1 hypothetical protein JN11_01542 [Mucilaginibacter frigoritolerans]
MEEFTNSRGYKIFYSIAAFLMIAFALFLLSLDRSRTGDGLLAFPIVIFLLALWIIVSQIRRKIIISADGIISINAFGTKEIPTANVKGCRITPKVIVIESAAPNHTKITINNYSDLGNSEDLAKWLKENFADLNEVDLKQEQEKLANDTSLGATEEERNKKIEKAKQISIAYNIWGGVGGFAMLFFSNKFTVLFLFLYPLAGILVMQFSSGLIKFVSDSKRSVYWFIVIGFMVPAIITLVKSIGDYEIYQFQNAFILIIISALFISFLLYKTGINNALPKGGQIFFMLLISVMYMYGNIVTINCVFDESKPQIIYTKVESVDISNSKGTHYYLYLKPWEEHGSPGSIEVSSKIYYRHPVGSSITVNLKHGLFNIPWFTVSN